jgi:hypothetical protein
MRYLISFKTPHLRGFVLLVNLCVSLSGNFKKIVDFDSTTGYLPVYEKLIEINHSGQGINKITNTINSSLFPNPNNGRFTIKLLGIIGKYSIEVYNLLGAKVLIETLSYSQNDNSVDINTQPNGVYLYRILDENGNQISNGKFVIQK